MITVHHLNKSRSRRVIWLLEELEMPYTLISHQRDPMTNLAPESLKKTHPLSKAPIMVDGDITICESGAIMEYILNQSTSHQLRPQINSKAYYQYLEWSHFAEGSLSLPLISTLLMQMETRQGSNPLDGYIAKEISLDFSYIEQYLSKHTYFAGENFTASDIMMTIMLEMADSLKLLADRKNINNYLENIKKRKAFQLAVSHG